MPRTQPQPDVSGQYDLVLLGVADRRPCTTAPDGTGIRCRCRYPCVNFYLRKLGLGPPDKEPELRDE